MAIFLNNFSFRDVLPSTHNDPIQKLQKEISEELNELNVYAQDITSTYKNPSTFTKTSTSEYKAPTSGYETNNSGYKAPTSGSGHATSGYEINNSGYKAPTSGYEIITSDSGDPTPATKVVGVGSFSSYESPPALPTYKKPVYTKISRKFPFPFCIMYQTRWFGHYPIISNINYMHLCLINM